MSSTRLAREWAPHRVTVNAITPATKTDAATGVEQSVPEAYAAAVAAIPMGRLGDPLGDIAPAALFLASPDSGDQSRAPKTCVHIVEYSPPVLNPTPI